MTGTVWHWLVHQGDLYHALVAWSVGFLMGGVVSLHLTRRVRVAWRKHEQTQAVIADRLDPHTPGGIGDLGLAVRRQPHKEEK